MRFGFLAQYFALPLQNPTKLRLSDAFNSMRPQICVETVLIVSEVSTGQATETIATAATVVISETTLPTQPTASQTGF